MKITLNRRTVFIWLAGAIITALLALLLRDFVRENIVAPLLNTAWIAWIGLLSVPQVVFWGLFLLVALVVALRSLSANAPPLRLGGVRYAEPYVSPSRYGYWRTALGALARSSFAHERVERELQNLVVQILAEQRRLAPDELRDQIYAGAADLSGEPALIQNLFKLDPHELIAPAPRGLAAWWARLRGRPLPSTAARVDVTALVGWVEERTGAAPR